MSELNESSIVQIDTPSYGNEVCFDPNHRRYKGCCRQLHATTGVRIICSMLWITVLFEIWHFGVTIYSNISEDRSSGSIETSLAQFLIGFFLAGTVLYALKREKSAFLVPYLVIQIVGLASSGVFFVAFIYIALFGEHQTAATFFRSYGRNVSRDDRNQERYLSYMSWMMVGSFAVIIALQLWLMTIVFACWRYFRDKHAFEKQSGYTYFVLNKSEKFAETPNALRLSLSVDAIQKKMMPRNRSRSISNDHFEQLNYV